jgi:hypothetical protein
MRPFLLEADNSKEPEIATLRETALMQTALWV